MKQIEFLERNWMLNLINLDSIVQMTTPIKETFNFEIRGLKGSFEFQGFIELSHTVGEDMVYVNIIPYEITDSILFTDFVYWWYNQMYTRPVKDKFLEISKTFLEELRADLLGR